MKKILFLFLTISMIVKAQETELGKSATEITLEVEIDAPIEKVWSELANIGNIYLNSPTVDTSYITSNIKTGVGASRHMIMTIGKNATLDERAIIWEEGVYQKFIAYKIVNVSGIKTMGGDFRLIQNGTKTILRSTLNYSMKNGFYGTANNMMGRKKFKKLWATILLGYKYHIETGNRATFKTKFDLNQAKLIEIKKHLNKKK